MDADIAIKLQRSFMLNCQVNSKVLTGDVEDQANWIKKVLTLTII